MKNIRINIFTIYFLLLSFLCGFIKNALIIFLIVFIHEMGHVLFISLFSYEIKSITIYPFGGITRVNKYINTPINEEIIIALGGIIFQIILGIIFLFLPISLLDKHIFFKYNLTIMIFNMLPIIPLDGSIIFSCILNYFFTFKNSYFIVFFISVISIVIFVIFNLYNSLNNYLIITFLLFKMFEYIKSYKYVYNKFLLERYMHELFLPKLRCNRGNIDILRKDTYQYFIESDGVKSEKVKLREKFDINKNNKL